MKKYQLAEDIIPKSKNDYLNNIFFLAENQMNSPVSMEDDILQSLEQQREFFEQDLRANGLI
jgi:hypothetical protein